jgi:hypothetical protein
MLKMFSFPPTATETANHSRRDKKAWTWVLQAFGEAPARALKRASNSAGIAIGPRRKILFLLVNKRFQHLAHHLQMIAGTRELTFQVDEIARRGVKTVRQEARHEP